MIEKGLYSVDEDLYETAATRYIQNNRCVFGWKMVYNARVNGVLYRRIIGLDIVPGDYIELARNHENPIKLRLEKPNKIEIKREGNTIIINTIINSGE